MLRRSIMLSLSLSLFITIAACRSSSDSDERPGVGAQALDGGGGQGGAGGAPSCEPNPGCNHLVDGETWCESCATFGGSDCPEGEAHPRAGFHDPAGCAPFLGPGGTALDDSCLDPGDYCSRCSGECEHRINGERDCAC